MRRALAPVVQCSGSVVPRYRNRSSGYRYPQSAQLRPQPPPRPKQAHQGWSDGQSKRYSRPNWHAAMHRAANRHDERHPVDVSRRVFILLEPSSISASPYVSAQSLFAIILKSWLAVIQNRELFCLGLKCVRDQPTIAVSRQSSKVVATYSHHNG